MRIVDLLRATPATTQSARIAFVAVTLLTTLGVLAAPAVAHAAACDNYEFAADFGLKQDNGLIISMSNPDTTALDNTDAQYSGPSGDLTTGHATGGITGAIIDFTITWDAGRSAGSVNHYTGVVGARGVANGLIETNGLIENAWASQGFKCMTAPSPAPDLSGVAPGSPG